MEMSCVLKEWVCYVSLSVEYINDIIYHNLIGMNV